MGIGTSIFLIAFGAILYFAVERGRLRAGDLDRRADPHALGALGLVISLFFLGQMRRAPAERTVVRDREPY